MDFGSIIKNDCVNIPLPPDARCDDPAFAFANPTLCPIVPKLILKPGSALVCLLGSLQFRAFYVANGVETDVTDSTVFTTNDPTVCVIGAKSGNATGIASGDVTISATYQALTADADLTVIGETNCCDDQSVAFMVMIDNSKSMSQAFGGVYPTKLAFARKAAQQFITEIDGTKDFVGLMTFNGFEEPIIDAPTHNKTAVAADVATVAQTSQSTTFFDPLGAAVNALSAVTADRKVIVIISDGQDQTSSDYATKNPVSTVEDFKLNGGLVICLGVRATGTGYTLLNTLSTGGFFVNSYVGIETDALATFGGIKGYMCGGNCVPEGDVFVGTGQLNYNGWANWSGQADLLGNGFVDLLPGNGLYVDLSSASAPFETALTSRVSYHVTAGKNYRLTMFLAGNQRVDLPSNVTVSVASASFVYINQTVSILDYTAGFAQYAFTFTPQTDDDVTIIIDGAGSTQLNIAGPLLDKIVFDNTTDLVNLLTDDFDGENVQYVPPRCGASSLGYATGYNCYSSGCLNSDPPPSQFQDPNALPDIEAGFIPPQMYSSTKTQCVTCPSGFVNASSDNLIPLMTGNTTPSGVASVDGGFNGSPAWPLFDHDSTTGWISGNDPTHWAQYQFAAATVVTGYAITISPLNTIFAPNGNVNESSPSDWTFQGSNDGVTWSDLDTQTGISWFAGERKLFQFANATAYLYYRVFLTDNTYLKNLFPSTVNLVFLLNEIEMFGTASSQACANATATSSVSQADADSKALASATTKANALLNCQRLYTSTQTFTAHCTAGALGTPVTKSGSATSFVSQDDADSKALAIAMEAANAALVCTGDNHNQAISINDLAAATPYPSVKYVSGETGHITNVTVTVKNFSHGSPSDVQMVLQSPSGTYVQLMLRCGGPGGSNPCSDLTFVFDDAAGGALPQFGALSGGTFKPSHYGITPNLLAPAAAAPYQATLAALIGEDPNGPWALWIVDLLGIGIGTVAGVPAFNVAITSA